MADFRIWKCGFINFGAQGYISVRQGIRTGNMNSDTSYHFNLNHVQNVIDSEVDASGFGDPIRMRPKNI